MSETPVIRLDLLGPARLTFRGRSLDDLARQAKRVAILTYLVLQEGYVRRDVLLALFWPEATDRQARSALSQAIFFLREQLGADAIESRGNGEIRVSPLVTADVVEFRGAMAEEQFGAALGLYRGELVAGLHVDSVDASSWLDDQRTFFRREAVRAACRHAEQFENDGWPRKAEEAARRALQIDPSDESAARLLIGVLLRSGSRPAAIEAYQAFRDRLDSEFGLEPSPETTALLASPPPEPSVGGPTIPTAPDATANLPEGGKHGSDVVSRAGPYAPGPRPFPSRSWKRILGIATMVVIVGLAYRIVAPGRSRGPRVAFPTNRVVVLYFDTRGDVGEDVAASLTEALVDQLSTADDFTVISAPAVRAFRGESVPIDTIAARFGSGSIVTGELAVRRDYVDVAARLILVADASQGRVIRATCKVTSAGTFPASCVRDINNGLREAIVHAMEIDRWRSATRNDQAWQRFERALDLKQRAVSLAGAGSFAQADQLYSDIDSLLGQAGEEERHWYAPYLLRARARKEAALFCIASRLCNSQTEVAELERALNYAHEAIKRYPADPAGCVELGIIHFLLSSESDRDGGETQLDSAIEAFHEAVLRAPANSTAWTWLSTVQLMRGAFADASASALTAFESDEYEVSRADMLGDLFQASFHLGRDLAAVHWCDEIETDFAGTWPVAFCRLSLLAFIDSVTPDPDSAWAAYYGHARADPSAAVMIPRLEMLVAAVLGRVGMPDSAVAVMKAALGSAGEDPELDLFRAGAFATLGAADSAIASLRRYVSAKPARRSAVLKWRWFEGLDLEEPIRDGSR